MKDKKVRKPRRNSKRLRQYFLHGFNKFQKCGDQLAANSRQYTVCEGEVECIFCIG